MKNTLTRRENEEETVIELHAGLFEVMASAIHKENLLCPNTPYIVYTYTLVWTEEYTVHIIHIVTCGIKKSENIVFSHLHKSLQNPRCPYQGILLTLVYLK